MGDDRCPPSLRSLCRGGRLRVLRSRFVDPFYYPVLFSWLTEAWRLREGDIQVTKGESNERTHFSFTQACFLLCVCSLLKTNGTEKRHTPHGVSDSIRPPQPFPLPQSPGSQVRSSFQSCIVCLAPPVYSIEVLRAPEFFWRYVVY